MEKHTHIHGSSIAAVESVALQNCQEESQHTHTPTLQGHWGLNFCSEEEKKRKLQWWHWWYLCSCYVQHCTDNTTVIIRDDYTSSSTCTLHPYATYHRVFPVGENTSDSVWPSFSGVQVRKNSLGLTGLTLSVCMQSTLHAWQQKSTWLNDWTTEWLDPEKQKKKVSLWRIQSNLFLTLFLKHSVLLTVDLLWQSVQWLRDSHNQNHY